MMTPIEIWRQSLASEVRDRVPELAALADRIEKTLPDDDPRFEWLKQLPRERQERFDDFLDMYTADEFRGAIEPYLEPEDRAILANGVTIGPDFTRRFLATPSGRSEVAGILAMALDVGQERDPRLN